MSQTNEFGSLSIALFTGNANAPLATEITRHLHVPLGRADVDRFSDGEVSVELRENVRGRDVFILQPTNPPAENLMELLMMTDACRRASAKRITAVVPYFGYGRQDRRPRATRVAITAKLVANMIASAGVDRLLTVDLHADQIQGFFDIPVDNVYASPVLLGDAWKQKYQNMVVVSPDVGGVVRARALAKRLDDGELAILDKRRPRPNEAKGMNFIGEGEGKGGGLGGGLHPSRGAVGGRDRAHRQVRTGRIGGDRHDSAVRCGPGVQAHPSADRGGTPGGNHPAHQRRGVGELAVRGLNRRRSATGRGAERCVVMQTGEDYEDLF